MLFCAVFIRISVQFCGIHTPLRPPQLAQWDLNKSTVNDFFASNLTRSTLLFAILKINNRKSYPRWRTKRRPKGDRRLSPEGRPRHEVPSKKKKDLASPQSLGLRSIECVTKL